MICILPHIYLEVKKVLRDKEGAYIILQGVLEGEQLTLVNLYGPNKNRTEVLK